MCGHTFAVRNNKGMEIQELIQMTPSELEAIHEKRKNMNDEEFSKITSFIFSLLKEELREETQSGIIKLEGEEKQASLERIMLPLINIRVFRGYYRYPRITVSLSNGNIVELELMIGYVAALETRIYPHDANEFQRLKSYLSGWSSRSIYYPDKGEPQMVLYNVIDCKGRILKDICKLAVSVVKDIVSGKTRY